MLTVIENIFSKQEIKNFRESLVSADWEDGKKTGGSLSTTVKTNCQLNEHSPLAVSLGNKIISNLSSHPEFLSAALPEKIYPPKFNCYFNGGEYGAHVDSAVMLMPNQQSLRTDLSATLFFSEPESYKGGELEIETAFGMQSIKLKAGDMILYPASSLHRVAAVTKGQRIASFLWVQSMVPDDTERALLYDLDQSIQVLTQEKNKDDPNLLRLTGIYHNLLRRWAKI